MIGVATLVLAIFLFLPIPFANGLPALSILMLALGLSERDGYWFVAGLCLAAVSTGLVIGVVKVGGVAILGLLTG